MRVYSVDLVDLIDLIDLVDTAFLKRVRRGDRA